MRRSGLTVARIMRLRNAAARRVVRRGNQYRYVQRNPYRDEEARRSAKLYRDAVALYGRLVCLDNGHDPGA